MFAKGDFHIQATWQHIKEHILVKNLMSVIFA
jgi:hypothetical protein